MAGSKMYTALKYSLIFELRLLLENLIKIPEKARSTTILVRCLLILVFFPIIVAYLAIRAAGPPGRGFPTQLHGLLSNLLGSEGAEVALADLFELFERDAQAHGQRYARLQYWTAVIGLLWRQTYVLLRKWWSTVSRRA